MRRVLLSGLICMLIALGAAVMPSGIAAAAGSTTTTAAQVPSRVQPLRWYGNNCRTLTSNLGDSGQICIIVNQNDITGGIQALVTFTSYSGALNHISVLDSVINFNGSAQQWTGVVSRPPNNSPTSGFISTNWSYHLYGIWWADVDDAYMQFTDGSAVSIPGWFQSGHVYAMG